MLFVCAVVHLRYALISCFFSHLFVSVYNQVYRENSETPTSQQYDDGEVHNTFRNQDQILQQALLDDASHSIYIDEESTIVGVGERARMQLAKLQKSLVCDNSMFLMCCLNYFRSLFLCTIFNVSIFLFSAGSIV